MGLSSMYDLACQPLQLWHLSGTEPTLAYSAAEARHVSAALTLVSSKGVPCFRLQGGRITHGSVQV